MTTIITILILAVIVTGIYFFVKSDGKAKDVKPTIPYTGWTGSGSPAGSGSTSGSAKPLGKIEAPEVLKETVKEAPKAKKASKKKDAKKPGAKRGRKPKNNNDKDQLLLS